MADLKKLADELVNLTVKDVKELADILKEEYGIEPAAAAVAVERTRGRLKTNFLNPNRLTESLESGQNRELKLHQRCTEIVA